MSDHATSESPNGSSGTGDSGTGQRQQGRGHGRRAVIIGTAAAGAGALAGLALPAGAAMASSEAVKPETTTTPVQLTVALQPSITLSQINALIARITGLMGCTACGLVGVDLRMFGTDPAEISDMQAIVTAPGVAGAVAY